MQRHLAFVIGGQKEDAAFRDVLWDGLAFHPERDVDRTVPMQHHQTIGKRPELTLKGTLALQRCERGRPAEAVAGRGKIGIEPLKNAVGVFGLEDGFRVHRKACRLANVPRQ